MKRLTELGGCDLAAAFPVSSAQGLPQRVHLSTARLQLFTVTLQSNLIGVVLQNKLLVWINGCACR
jgi:hypothetical protein